MLNQTFEEMERAAYVAGHELSVFKAARAEIDEQLENVQISDLTAEDYRKRASGLEDELADLEDKVVGLEVDNVRLLAITERTCEGCAHFQREDFCRLLWDMSDSTRRYISVTPDFGCSKWKEPDEKEKQRRALCVELKRKRLELHKLGQGALSVRSEPEYVNLKAEVARLTYQLKGWHV